MTDRERQETRLRMVKIILHWVWDPIGVRGMAGAVDEYDRYAFDGLSILEGRSPPDQNVVDLLTRVEREEMGLTPVKHRNEDVAAALKELYGLFD